MTATTTRTTDVDVDLLGLGFGPSNMALAVAVEEHNASAAPADRVRAVFHERQTTSRWHHGMLFTGARMQVAFAKDLVTLRNPTSDYSFLAFLHESGRLVDFLNRGSLTPLRIEFAAYLRWAAARLDAVVRYGSTVGPVTPVLDAGRVVAFDVTVTDAAGTRVTRARDVVVAAGLQPALPHGVTESGRVWHNHRFLDRVAEARGDVRSVVVVGAGQSAAEILLYLYEELPGARLHSVSRRYGLSPSDSSPYANSVFDPDAVDVFYEASPQGRERLLGYHSNTNYGVVADDTIRGLFEREYRDRWLGEERLTWHRGSDLLAVEDDGEQARVRLADHLAGTTSTLTADLVVLATGYRPLDPTSLLGDAAPLVVRDDAGRPVLERDHRARLHAESDAALYLVGQSEHTHGLSATLLSTVGVRAGELLDSVLVRRAARPPTAPVPAVYAAAGAR